MSSNDQLKSNVETKCLNEPCSPTSLEKMDFLQLEENSNFSTPVKYKKVDYLMTEETPLETPTSAEKSGRMFFMDEEVETPNVVQGIDNTKKQIKFE
eukprot:gene7299-11618_t